MRKRAFIPDAPSPLEDRATPSSGAGPVRLTAAAYGINLGSIRNDYEQYATSGDLHTLRVNLSVRAGVIPFGRVDGLGPKINAIVDKMEANIAAGTPGSVAMAQRETIATIRADVLRLMRSGMVVIVK